VYHPVQVLRGRHGDERLIGPLPGVQSGAVVAYEFELPSSFEPWPGRTRLERTFVLLDLGVSLANPCWVRNLGPAGQLVNRAQEGRDTWYVDLVSIERHTTVYVVRDLYIDVMVPLDGRHHRLLDLEEFADAVEHGVVAIDQAMDALRRWQRFLDQHLHAGRAPVGAWTDFPPAVIAPLRDLPPFGDPVRV